MKVFCAAGLTTGWVMTSFRPPELSAVFVVKGTYRLSQDGEPTLYDEPDPARGDLYLDDDFEKPLLYDSDFALFKPRTDLLLVGSCHAPGGRSIPMTRVTFSVGSFVKSLAVIGDREWKEGVFSDGWTGPKPFTSMPVRYDYAFGGEGNQQNPLGKGAKTRELPNIENPDRLIGSRRDAPPPAGFGPVDRRWSPRTRFAAAKYDKKWLDERWPWLPEDFDWGYFNAAPLDQQGAGYLRGDEPLFFENLHPRHAQYRSRLPGLRARCFIDERVDGMAAFREVPLRLDTLFVDMDAEKLVLVWRGAAVVRSKKLVEVEGLFAVTERLTEPVRSVEEYRARFEALASDEEATEAEVGSPAEEPPTEDEFALDAALASMEKDFEDAAAQTAKAESELLAKLKAKGAENVAFGTTPPGDDPGAVPKEAAAAFAVLMANLKKRAPDAAAALGDLAVEDPPEEEWEKELPEEPDKPPWTRESVIEAATMRRVLSGEDLSELDLSVIDFRGLDLSDSRLSKSNLSGAILSGCNLRRTIASGANFEKADLTSAIMDEADFSGSNLAGALLVQASFEDSDLSGCDLRGADLSGCRGKGSYLSESDLSRARMRDARLPSAVFAAANLSEADLGGAHLQAAVVDGVRAPRINLEGADITGLHANDHADLSGGNLKNVIGPGSIWEEAILDEADFTRASLAKANFTGASLAKARLAFADLKSAVFAEARLHGAVLAMSNLLRSSFEEADLHDTDFQGANLYEAEFWEAKLKNTKFHGANLKMTKLARHQR